MTELADTSAWITSGRDPELRRQFHDAVVRSEVATCEAVVFELLHSTRSAREFTARRSELELLPRSPLGSREWQRALDVCEMLALQGGLHHRRVKHFDLLIAAAAESAELPVLHYDADFDIIAEITGQPMRWIAPRGSL